jgi:hypothetical protein
MFWFMLIYGTKNHFKVILDGSYPRTSRSGIANEDKWLTTPDMGHIIATCYNGVVCSIHFARKRYM